MGTPFYIVRRELAMEMDLWGGKVDGQAPGSANFTSVDVANSLYVVYDINRPEPDGEWNGSYICINPGGTGDSNLATIWRRIADDTGFINSNGAMTLTSPLPSAAYAQTTMTYELFKSFTPEQWIKAVNYALRTAYPQRHRIIAFEIPEDPSTVFYDWAHLATGMNMTDPSIAPTVSNPADPGGHTNYWGNGVFSVAYSYYNAIGETVISPLSPISLSSSMILEFASISVPEQAIGVNYWCTQDANGSLLTQLSTGSGFLPDSSPDNIVQEPGIADRTTATVPRIQFWGPPTETARVTPAFNTSVLDTSGLSLKTIRRRVNRGQYPESYIDLNPQWWREVGGTSVKVNFRPTTGFDLRFECMAPVRVVTGESDATEEPLELIIAGGMLYLWNLQAMIGSSQNVVIWTAEAKIAEARFTKARNLYQMPGPRKTMRRPFINVQRWWGGSF